MLQRQRLLGETEGKLLLPAALSLPPPALVPDHGVTAVFVAVDVDRDRPRAYLFQVTVVLLPHPESVTDLSPQCKSSHEKASRFIRKLNINNALGRKGE